MLIFPPLKKRVMLCGDGSKEILKTRDLYPVEAFTSLE